MSLQAGGSKAAAMREALELLAGDPAGAAFAQLLFGREGKAGFDGFGSDQLVGVFFRPRNLLNLPAGRK